MKMTHQGTEQTAGKHLKKADNALLRSTANKDKHQSGGLPVYDTLKKYGVAKGKDSLRDFPFMFFSRFFTEFSREVFTEQRREGVCWRA